MKNKDTDLSMVNMTLGRRQSPYRTQFFHTQGDFSVDRTQRLSMANTSTASPGEVMHA